MILKNVVNVKLGSFKDILERNNHISHLRNLVNIEEIRKLEFKRKNWSLKNNKKCGTRAATKLFNMLWLSKQKIIAY
jgi:hypothetical protein